MITYLLKDDGKLEVNPLAIEKELLKFPMLEAGVDLERKSNEIKTLNREYRFDIIFSVGIGSYSYEGI